MGRNHYKRVTNRIIELLNQGIIPWHKGWSGGSNGAYNYATKRPYNLLNTMLLDHQDGYITEKMCVKLGGAIREGAHAEFVSGWFWEWEEDPKHLDEDGNPIKKKKWNFKTYDVYWVGDTTLPRKDFKPIEHDPISEAEEIISAYVARERHFKFQNDQPSSRAYYAPLLDKVVVPMMSQFENVEEYYSTAFHELTHSTGASKRLGRLKESDLAAFGSEDYSKEELVAELGAAMLVNHCGIETEKSFRNSAGYIQGWLKALKGNQYLITSASTSADKAVKYILGVSE